MKKFIKNNKVSLIIFSILLIAIIIASINYALQYNKMVKIQNEIYLPLSIETGTHLPEPNVGSTYNVFYYLLYFDFSFMQMLAPLILIVPGIWDFHKDLKTGYFKNKLTRISYKKYIRKSLLKSLRNAWILPAFIICVFIASFIVSGGSLDLNDEPTSLGYSLSGTDLANVQMGWKFAFVFLFNITLNAIFYINLGLLCVKKNKNIFVSIIVGYILFIVWAIISEIVIGHIILPNVFYSARLSEIFNLFTIWVYDVPQSLIVPITIYSLLLAGLSTFIVLVSYRNKESVVIECEK